MTGVGPQTLTEALDRQVGERPSAAFLTQVETGATLTFSQTRDATAQLATALGKLGVSRGDMVATMLPNGVESVLAWFACARLGAIEAPIGIAYKGVLLQRLVDLCEARVMVVDAAVVDDIADVLVRAGKLDHILVAGTDEVPEALRSFGGTVDLLDNAVRSAGPPAEPADTAMSDIACLLFTSGTTGGSRGVLCTYAQEHEGAVAAPPALASSDAIYSTSPPNHVGQKLLLYKALIVGCRFVMRKGFSLSAFWSDINDYECTTTLLLGGAANYLLSQPESEDDGKSTLRSTVMIPLHPRVNEFRERFGIAVHSIYNMTEICPVAVLTDEEVRDHRRSGRMRPGFDWRLVDEKDHEVAPGEPGELILRPRDPWLFSQGYFRDDAKTVESFRNLWFHTGDMFTADDEGYIYFLDRAKDVVRRRGENISSAELEYIAAQHEQVLEAAVVGVPSEHTEEEIKLVVVVSDGFTDAVALRDFISQRAPRFMVPRYIQFVDELPKTPTLKVRKGELRQQPQTGDLFDLAERRLTR